MTVVLIEPIEFATKLGETIVVTGIHMFDPDPFRGHVVSQAGTRRDARFRCKGEIRDDHPDCNIPMSTEKGDYLYRAARILRREDM